MTMTALPAIPEPSSTPVPALLDACEAVVMWAEGCDDLPLVQEVYDRMAAVAEYLSRQEHAVAAQASLRRLEQRIGTLLGPASPNGRYDESRIPHVESKLPANRASDFRRIATHPEVVDEVIAESTEASPPSRRKVLEAIKSLEQAAREAHREDAREQEEWAESITPDDYDPAEDERSAAVQKAILSAEQGLFDLARYTLPETRSCRTPKASPGRGSPTSSRLSTATRCSRRSAPPSTTIGWVAYWSRLTVRARNDVVQRNQVLRPLMEEHGFITAGEAIDWLNQGADG